MKTFLLSATLIILCAPYAKGNNTVGDSLSVKVIGKLSKKLTEAERKRDLKTFLSMYLPQSIDLPEYQPLLQGKAQIEDFYSKIFARQNIKQLNKQIEEVFTFEKTAIEIGTFEKEYTEAGSDSLIIHTGKYWNVWEKQAAGDYKIKGRSYGFFHPIAKPESLMIDVKSVKFEEEDITLLNEPPFELMAYNALMEKGVRLRDGNFRSKFFTADARVMPFQEPTVSGIKQIKPYLIAYSNRGQVTIDSISCYTYDYQDLGEYLIEYDKFRVQWSAGNAWGKVQGKGIRLWKRLPDKSLRIFREIGTHDFIN